MKSKLVFSLLVLFGFITAYGQDLPNGGFEKWEEGVFKVQQPEGWFTSSIFIPFSKKLPVTRVEDKFSGNYAMRLETVKEQIDGKDEIIPGWAISGKFDLSTLQLGFPYESRPSKMMFKYKYAPYDNDTMIIAIELRKYIPGYGQLTVGYGYFNSTLAVNEYSQGEIDIYYEYSDIPDSAVVIIQSGTDTLHAGSVLHIDEMQFAFALASKETVKNNNVKNLVIGNPYPQPAKFNSDIYFPVNIKSEGNVKIELFDVTGRLVGEKQEHLFPGNTTIKYDTENLKPGMYLYNLKMNGEAYSGKIIISE